MAHLTLTNDGKAHVQSQFLYSSAPTFSRFAMEKQIKQYVSNPDIRDFPIQHLSIKVLGWVEKWLYWNQRCHCVPLMTDDKDVRVNEDDITPKLSDFGYKMCLASAAWTRRAERIPN